MALTDLQIRNAEPREKPYKRGDGGGLYLLINPDGSKWWQYKYRFGGKEKLLSIGIYPQTKGAEARKKHIAARDLLVQGIDPSASRQETKRRQAEAQQAAADTFELVALAWMTSEHKKVAYVTASKNRWLY
jgi:hypothetical protein